MRWWDKIAALDGLANQLTASMVHPTAIIEDGALLDDRAGAIRIGAGTRICSGALIRGPVEIGADCLLGNAALVRGPTTIADGTRIGHAVEIKRALIGIGVAIGPMCFVADSWVDCQAYLGAMVRTSNQRLDRKPVFVRHEGKFVPTGADKLGCWIGAQAALGIQVIILPGRVVAPRSLIEPRVTITQNLPTGRYRVRQELEMLSLEGNWE